MRLVSHPAAGLVLDTQRRATTDWTWMMPEPTRPSGHAFNPSRTSTWQTTAGSKAVFEHDMRLALKTRIAVEVIYQKPHHN